MEDTAMYNTHSHMQIPVPAPKDLDDLIFQGEVWLISDRGGRSPCGRPPYIVQDQEGLFLSLPRENS